jgi:hypothetical protein
MSRLVPISSFSSYSVPREFLMMNRKTTIVLVIGILLGSIAVEAIHIIRDKHRHEVFEERLRCKGLADAYLKAETEEDSYTTLDRVDFSPSRNTCIVATRQLIYRHWSERFAVVDVISGESLFHGWCTGDDATSKSYCGNGGNVRLKSERDKVFDKAIGSFWLLNQHYVDLRVGTKDSLRVAHLMPHHRG